MNMNQDFDPIINRSTCPVDRMPRIVVSGSNISTSSVDIMIERDFQDLVRSTFLEKYPELLSADILPIVNILTWFNIQIQTNQSLALEPISYMQV